MDWLNRRRASACLPPRRARLPLWLAGQLAGSVEPGVFERLGTPEQLRERYALVRAKPTQSIQPEGWHVAVAPGQGDELSAALQALAVGLRDVDCCGPWRDEQLAVLNTQGQRLATVERGAVRVLGLATQAVHLVGFDRLGRMWVQQRSLDKANDPGLWDTLMGGMVSAADSLQEALARETWEEAGLRVDQLLDVRYGGHVDFNRPSHEAGGTGYMIERIDWFQCTVPEGLAPDNQDGEVAQFELLPLEPLRERMAQDGFTLEATLIATAALGW